MAYGTKNLLIFKNNLIQNKQNLKSFALKLSFYVLKQMPQIKSVILAYDNEYWKKMSQYVTYYLKSRGINVYFLHKNHLGVPFSFLEFSFKKLNTLDLAIYFSFFDSKSCKIQTIFKNNQEINFFDFSNFNLNENEYQFLNDEPIYLDTKMLLNDYLNQITSNRVTKYHNSILNLIINKYQYNFELIKKIMGFDDLGYKFINKQRFTNDTIFRVSKTFLTRGMQFNYFARFFINQEVKYYLAYKKLFNYDFKQILNEHLVALYIKFQNTFFSSMLINDNFFKINKIYINQLYPTPILIKVCEMFDIEYSFVLQQQDIILKDNENVLYVDNNDISFLSAEYNYRDSFKTFFYINEMLNYFETQQIDIFDIEKELKLKFLTYKEFEIECSIANLVHFKDKLSIQKSISRIEIDQLTVLENKQDKYIKHIAKITLKTNPQCFISISYNEISCKLKFSVFYSQTTKIFNKIKEYFNKFLLLNKKIRN